MSAMCDTNDTGYDNPALETDSDNSSIPNGVDDPQVVVKQSPVVTNDTRNGVSDKDKTAMPSSVPGAEDCTEDLRCGLGGCKPSWLQVFNTPRWVLVWLCWFSLIQGLLNIHIFIYLKLKDSYIS